MGKVKKLLAGEFEKTIFWSLLALLMIWVCFLYARLGKAENGVGAGKGAPSRIPILGDSAYAFLQTPPEARVGKTNPFNYRVRIQQTRPKKRVWEKPRKAGPRVTRKARPKIKPKVRPAKATVNRKVQTKPRPKPRARPRVRMVKYLGTVTTTTGKVSAYVKIRDAARRGGASPKFVQKGGALAGFKISGFTEDALEVVDPDGGQHKIAFGHEKKIVLK